MYTLTATYTIKKWLDSNLKKYEINSSNKYITNAYSGKTTKGDNFSIKVYTSNIITIEGSLKKRIYEKLIFASDEHNYEGMDEVGVGDFFGPVVYVSIKMDENSLHKLSKSFFPIKDSKKLDNLEIINIYNTLKNDITFKKQIVFDKDVPTNLNSVGQKTFYHNKNIIDLKDKLIIDLFTTEKAFYKYSSELNLTWNNDLILETKADGKYLSVALASIFARAIFLEEIEKLSKKYDFQFPLGATNVLPAAREFCQRYSKKELSLFAKTSFKTFNEI